MRNFYAKCGKNISLLVYMYLCMMQKNHKLTTMHYVMFIELSISIKCSRCRNMYNEDNNPSIHMEWILALL